MKSADFNYHRPREVNEALTLLKEVGEEGKILAGGQSLMPMMNFRLAEPAHLIDINFIDGLDYVRSENSALKIGCLARQSRLLSDALVRQRCPLLAAAMTHVGYEQTRNRGTLCGSLAHADPAAELPAVLLALDGSLTVGNSTRKREIAARDFFQSYLTTALANDEMVFEASVPEQPARSGSSFVEFARRFGDFAIVGVAASLTLAKEQITDARIALTGVSDKPWRERWIEEILIGKKAAPDLFNKAAGEIAANIDPSSDIHGSAAYRKSLANVLTRRALNEALQKARIGD
ncbi:MAG TPA: xanthine dehydrogenase family protein subunit M [Candidatus Limnocylindrales bacterium]|nr:xanthine dehydrogenase family protein subunit M [Candidatus Limnocylindrales bacterium]